MSHHDTLRRMNAELNTPETWARRWQIEREENERLNAEAGMVRARVREMRARAVEGYGRNQREASAAIGAGNHSRAEALDRACASGMGKTNNFAASPGDAGLGEPRRCTAWHRGAGQTHRAFTESAAACSNQQGKTHQ